MVFIKRGFSDMPLGTAPNGCPLHMPLEIGVFIGLASMVAVERHSVRLTGYRSIADKYLRNL